MSNSRRKFISFSVDLDFDIGEKIYNHVMSKGKGHKSEYLRMLIYNDIMSVRNMVTTTTHVVVEENNDDDTEAMKGFF